MDNGNNDESVDRQSSLRRQIQCAYCLKTFGKNYLRHCDMVHPGVPPAEIVFDENNVKRVVYYHGRKRRLADPPPHQLPNDGGAPPHLGKRRPEGDIGLEGSVTNMAQKRIKVSDCRAVVPNQFFADPNNPDAPRHELSFSFAGADNPQDVS